MYGTYLDISSEQESSLMLAVLYGAALLESFAELCTLAQWQRNRGQR